MAPASKRSTGMRYAETRVRRVVLRVRVHRRMLRIFASAVGVPQYERQENYEDRDVKIWHFLRSFLLELLPLPGKVGVYACKHESPPLTNFPLPRFV